MTLRPMTEGDWELVMRISNDPNLGYYTEGDDWTPYTLEEIQRIYRSISQQAFMFVIEREGQPVGECWLQRMNLSRLLDRYESLDCRRIDLAIADPEQRGRGLGSRAIRLLVQFGFAEERADAIFACDVWDYNLASRRAFEKVGFRVIGILDAKPGAKGRAAYDLAIFHEHSAAHPRSG
ncbi:MAG: GNAT family N-acetyltransferase [Thermomicrobiales bacterium]